MFTDHTVLSARGRHAVLIRTRRAEEAVSLDVIVADRTIRIKTIMETVAEKVVKGKFVLGVVWTQHVRRDDHARL